MSVDIRPTPPAQDSARQNVTLQIVSVVMFTFIGYLTIGIPLAVLPGYVHDDLGYGSVLAEKQAQASVIRRREEANATRSQLNTAKLIEDNPVLMRLKELEALEKVTEKIDTLTVFGGLDGVLKQLVTIR